MTSQQFINDTVGETNASIHLSLAANPTVYELGSPARGFMKIWDDDAPELKVVAGDTILEAAGAMANFTISSKASPNRSVVVYADLVETGDFIAVEGINRSYTLDFTAGKKEATVSIPIINNSYPESDGTITLTLKPDSANPPTYMVAADPNNSAVVNVKDDESLPVVSIMADSGGIGENANQTPFVLQATGLTATTTLMINATPAEDGHDFLTNTVAGTASDFAVEFSDPDGDGNYTGNLLVTLDNDDIAETTGTIKATLNNSTATIPTYQLGSTTEGSLTIWDDDAPELLIKSPGNVLEAAGGTVNFTIEARVSPNNIISVYYNVMESTGMGVGDFIANHNEGSSKLSQLDFRGNKTNVMLRLPLVNDGNIEGDSTVTMTLIEESAGITNYAVAESPNNSAVATLIDDDNPFEVAISSGAVTTGVTERYAFDFKVRSNRPVNRNLDVSIFITEAIEGNNSLRPTLQGGGNKVTIPRGEREVSGTVLLASSGNVPTSGGSINLTIGPDPTRYTISDTATTIAVPVKDADTGNATTPVISLSGPTSAVEGTPAIYNVSVSHTPNNAPRLISLKVENTTGDFLAANQDGIRRVSVSSASTPGKLNVLTKADDPDGSAGVIKVTLVEGTGYALPVLSSNLQVSTNVVDPAIQDVSISSIAETSGVTEGYSFEFTVSSLVNVDADLPVMVTITDENNDNLNPSLQGSGNIITIPFGQRTATGVIEMNLGAGDGVDIAAPGQIKVVVNPVVGRYRVNSSENEVLVPVKDSDTGSAETPIMSISGTTSLVEGGTAHYSVSASHTPTNVPLVVSVMATNTTGNFLVTHEIRTHQVSVSSANTPGTLEIDTVADNPDGDAGTITMTLS